MLMVVFGAGASYDSAPDITGVNLNHTHRPPLADDLFERTKHKESILKLYKQVGPVFGLFSRSRRGDLSLEEALQEFLDGAPSDPTRFCQLAAVKFYLRDLIREIAAEWNTRAAQRETNYMALLEQLHRAVSPNDQPILLVTFNYDTLIDDAVSAWPDHEINDIDDYVTHDRFKLFKLHGSTNWGRTIDLSESQRKGVAHYLQRGRLATFYIKNAASFRYLDEYLLTDHALHEGDRYFMPALSVPLAQKNSINHGDWPLSHLNALYELLPNVDRILTIGWSAGDTYFLDEILKGSIKPSAQLLTVGQDIHDAVKIAEQIASHIDVRPESGSPHGFTDFVAKGDGLKFMAGE